MGIGQASQPAQTGPDHGADRADSAVHRYFASKNELITAVAEQVMDQVIELLTPIVGQDPPPTLDQVVQQGLDATDEIAFGDDGFARLAPQVWAENPARRRPRRSRARPLDTITGMFSELVVAEQKAERVAADGNPDEVAQVLLGTILGYILQRLLVGNVDPRSYASGLGALTTHT